jgi:hypothetical protein
MTCAEKTIFLQGARVAQPITYDLMEVDWTFRINGWIRSTLHVSGYDFGTAPSGLL